MVDIGLAAAYGFGGAGTWFWMMQPYGFIETRRWRIRWASASIIAGLLWPLALTIMLCLALWGDRLLRSGKLF